MSFRSSPAFAKAMMMGDGKNRPSAIAVVTGGKSGIGRALVLKIASFPFIAQVLAVSRSITAADFAGSSSKIQALAADVGTAQGRDLIVQKVHEFCHSDSAEPAKRTRQLRFLVHSAGTIEPIKPVLQVQQEELRQAMLVNCEAPFFLTTALYPYMTSQSDNGVAGRVLHVSSGAAHGAPPVGWSVYGITKAAFFQSYKVLEREFRQAGGKVVVGSFKPGVVDTTMQSVIRDAPADAMPVVQNFKNMKERATMMIPATAKARPPPAGALDSPDNVAHFAEFLLVGTTDDEFANSDDPNEYDIRNEELFPKWISPDELL